MKYLMIYTDRMEDIEALSLEARGELLTMCMAYCADESLVVTAADFKTEAKFLWPSFRRMIDAQRDNSSKQAENGAKGGRPKKTQQNPEKPTEIQQNPTKPNESPIVNSQ